MIEQEDFNEQVESLILRLLEVVAELKTSNPTHDLEAMREALILVLAMETTRSLGFPVNSWRTLRRAIHELLASMDMLAHDFAKQPQPARAKPKKSTPKKSTPKRRRKADD